MSDDAEVRARLLLLHASEPGSKSLGAFVREHGAQDAVQRILAGNGPSRMSEAMARRVAAVDIDSVFQRLEELANTVVLPGSPQWPTQLDDLGAAAPFALLVRGVLPVRVAASRSVAIVGARASTEYGERIAAGFAADLCEVGWTVVSGAAYGIDAAAHRGALVVGGSTIAVVASGIDVVYPAAHDRLFANILDRGVLVSESPPGQRPTRAGFLARNRVIAALTAGTVVVEAAHRSGALNTATWAAGLARHVMAVPGPVTSTASAGCHQLVRDHVANLVTSGGDVIDLVGALPDMGESDTTDHSLVLDSLTAEGALVFEALPGRGGASAEAIASHTGLRSDEVVTALGQLLLAGLVRHGESGWSVVKGLGGTPGRSRP
jgi:DNA processing protein